MKRRDDILEFDTVLLRPFNVDDDDIVSRALLDMPLSGRRGVAMLQIRMRQYLNVQLLHFISSPGKRCHHDNHSQLCHQPSAYDGMYPNVRVHHRQEAAEAAAASTTHHDAAAALFSSAVRCDFTMQAGQLKLGCKLQLCVRTKKGSIRVMLRDAVRFFAVGTRQKLTKSARKAAAPES